MINLERIRTGFSFENPALSKISSRIAFPMLNLILFISIELFHIFNIKIPNIIGIFTITTLLSILKVGSIPGIISSLIMLSYSVLFSVRHYMHYGRPGFLMFINIVNTLILLGLAILGGFILRRPEKYLKTISDNEKKYKLLFNNSNDLIFLYETAEDGLPGKLLEINDTACKRLGYKRDELLKMELCELLSYEKALPLKNGTKIPVEINSHDFTLNGKSVTIAIARDISERRQIEQELLNSEKRYKQLVETVESEKRKIEFFANLSHELRTPLNVIMSALQLSELYAKKNVDGWEKTQKYTNILKQNCFRLLRLVNNIIDTTKIDAGFLDLKLQNHNIVNIIEEITLSISHYTESKGISIQFDTETDEKLIACDIDKIERIMLNLLSNAIKFTEPGGSIYVNIYDRDKHIVITVKDTGIGIPVNKQGIIFERFRQADQSLARRHEGSGIGLSLVKSLVEMHEGTIRLESEPGKGSMFIIKIPVKLLSEDMNASEICGDMQQRVEKIKVELSDIYQKL